MAMVVSSMVSLVVTVTAPVVTATVSVVAVASMGTVPAVIVAASIGVVWGGIRVVAAPQQDLRQDLASDTERFVCADAPEFVLETVLELIARAGPGRPR
jgi:hypothetical protein